MKKVVTFGEIMLRLAPQGFLRFSQATSFDAIYGGGESNVAVSLANYGVPVDFVTRLPKNDIGECAMMEMRKRGVGVDKIVWGGDRLGIYFLETGAVSRGSKVVYDRAHSAISEIESGMIDWDAVFGIGTESSYRYYLNSGTNTQTNGKTTIFSTGISPGISVQLSKWLFMDASIGRIGYGLNRYKPDNKSDADEERKFNSFSFNFNTFRFGLSAKLGK